MSAHTLQMAWACSLPLAMAPDANLQISAQSMSSAMHRAIIFTSDSCRQAVEQWLQAIAHWSHASMQELYCW